MFTTRGQLRPMSTSLTMTSMDILFADFDETITERDTLSELASVVYDDVCPDFKPRWSYFVDAYLKDHAAMLAKVGGPSTAKTLSEELAFLSSKSAREVEAASITRVANSGLFAGVTIGNLSARAAQIRLRPGFRDCALAAAAASIPLIIVSVNWSVAFVTAVLEANGIRPAAVHANEIAIPPSSGQKADILTGTDKSAVVKSEMVARNASRACYIGDSVGDLDPLTSCRPSVEGVLIIQKPSVIEACKRIGVQLVPLAERSHNQINEFTKDFLNRRNEDALIYVSEHWNQIKSMLIQ
ncbi:hypothetical protein V1511DRAFT_507159 [Dipodascopsis uninucleata]